jgi:hypothetical protein
LKEIRRGEPTVAQLIADGGTAKGIDGDMQAVNYASESIVGQLPQETQLTGKGGADLM